jgi:hypothetical protein
VKVNDIPAGSENRVLEGLEVLPHVFEDRIYQIAGRPERLFRPGVALVRNHDTLTFHRRVERR